MTTIDPTTLAPFELATMLRSWADGLYSAEAAVGLLIANGTWLERPDFLAELVDAVDGGWGHRGSVVPMAAIEWERIPRFAASAPASSSELAVLQLGAAVAGHRGASLAELTTSLDDTNGRHLLDAVAHSLGWHERGTRHLVTGHQADRPARIGTPRASAVRVDEAWDGVYLMLGDAADRLQTHPAGAREAGDAVQRAVAAIQTAKQALNEAADLESRRSRRWREQ